MEAGIAVHVWSIEEIVGLLANQMRLTKTTIAVEIAVLLSILVLVEWLAHVLTNTRDMFVPAVLTLGVYVGLRTAISARRRRAGNIQNSN